MSAETEQREPDAEAIGIFVRTLFAYADEASFVSLRAFFQLREGPPPYIRGSQINGSGLNGVITDAVAGARFAANFHEPLVFAPPVATFRCAKKADEISLVNGLAISTELDQGDTTRARQRLEGLLGPATVVVASGGEWIDPETGEIFAKLHLHWRLSEPTRDSADHAALKHARRLACALVTADPTATTSVHPLRWAGTWHLKNTPKLASLVTWNAQAEVHLPEALAALEDAAEQAGLNGDGAGPQPGGDPQAPIALVRSALAAVPNDDEHWDQWIKIGLAVYASTAGSAAGLDAWIEWSAKSTKYVAGSCDERWAHFRTSPPTKIGFGTIAFWAKANGWKRPDPPPGDQRGPAPDANAGPPATLFDPWAELQPPYFPIDALPPVLRDFAEDRARVLGADVCALAWAGISATSAALNGSIRLKMKKHDNWSVPPAFWVALVGTSGAKKTPIKDAAWEPLQRAQKSDLDQWREQVANWKALPKDKRDPDEPKPRRRLVSHDGTMEALQDILGRQDRGIGVLRDELAGWIGQLEKYGGAKASGADRAFFLQAYNGGPNVIDRVGRGMIAIDNLLVTIFGGIQPERLRQFHDLTDDGLWQRFVPIIVAPPSRGVDEWPGPAVTAYADAINRILTVPGETRVELSEGAHEVRADIERRVFELEQSDVLGARFTSFCGKLAGTWGRLCLVLNYLDPAPVHFIVPQRTAERAATLLFQSVIPSAARIYAASGGAGADVEATRSVAGYILTKHKTRVLASELARDVRVCRGQPLDQTQRILSPLVAGGWLTPGKDWNPSAWIVVPGVHEQFAAQREREKAKRSAIRDVLTTRESGDQAE